MEYPLIQYELEHQALCIDILFIPFHSPFQQFGLLFKLLESFALLLSIFFCEAAGRRAANFSRWSLDSAQWTF